MLSLSRNISSYLIGSSFKRALIASSQLAIRRRRVSLPSARSSYGEICVASRGLLFGVPLSQRLIPRKVPRVAIGPLFIAVHSLPRDKTTRVSLRRRVGLATLPARVFPPRVKSPDRSPPSRRPSVSVVLSPPGARFTRALCETKYPGVLVRAAIARNRRAAERGGPRIDSRRMAAGPPHNPGIENFYAALRDSRESREPLVRADWDPRAINSPRSFAGIRRLSHGGIGIKGTALIATSTVTRTHRALFESSLIIESSTCDR